MEKGWRRRKGKKKLEKMLDSFRLSCYYDDIKKISL